MQEIGLIVGALSCLIAATLALCWWQDHRDLRQLRIENERLHTLVEQRVERPAVFSHEVRTPLALISGAAELLGEETPGPLTAQQRHFVDTIIVNARQVGSIAEDVLTEARLSSSLFRLAREQLDLRQVVRDAVAEIRRIHAVPIRLSNDGPPLLLEADPGLIRQALWNLINNAVRHAGPGAQIGVDIIRGETEAVIQVTDTGSGIDDADRDTLFQAFVAGTSTNPGTGLGMAITHSIISAHDGRILVDSRPGAGMAIYVTLPFTATGDRS